MGEPARDLLAEIEQDALDESKSVSSALRKCVALGGQAGSADLREWAARELRGYPGAKDELPEYRHVQAPLLMDGFTADGSAQFKGKSVSVIDLPREARDVVGDIVHLTYGVGKIEALTRQADAGNGFIQLGPPGAAELAIMMTHEVRRYQVERVYWSVSAADLRSVVDAVRTALVELVAEMRAGTSAGAQLPAPDVATQAVQVAVYGSKNRITLNTAMAKEDGTAIVAPQADEVEESGFWTATRIVWAAIIGIATIVGAVAAVLALHPHWHF